ncbi:hypothetical protein [Pseudoalteromonas sp. PS5]|uniref:hypothetical protein n=1 Tax=Pseudoalteromonas sp. PS5 TaxID=1437473 RepID=UPI000FFEB3BC|nr:hypothetical protein [Pseudoalteromonas sp. PS5]RXF02108.1 hypothetical protein D9603_11790 [Pseudoalteromonas sp. PS5]
MKAIVLTALLLSGHAFANNDALVELVEASQGAAVTINNQEFIAVEANSVTLTKGLQLQSPSTGELYTVTGEIIVEHLSVIDATTFAQDNTLVLSYVRGNRAIYRHADSQIDLQVLNAQLRAQPGVLSTQIGLQLEGLESE